MILYFFLLQSFLLKICISVFNFALCKNKLMRLLIIRSIFILYVNRFLFLKSWLCLESFLLRIEIHIGSWLFFINLWLIRTESLLVYVYHFKTWLCHIFIVPCQSIWINEKRIYEFTISNQIFTAFLTLKIWVFWFIFIYF